VGAQGIRRCVRGGYRTGAERHGEKNGCGNYSTEHFELLHMTAYSTAVGMLADAAAAPPSTAAAVTVSMMASRATVRMADLLLVNGSYWRFGAAR
jgi:hypothetical protein